MEIVSVEEIGTVQDEYVYDIETEEGTYLAGDNILLKNTDSCYVKFDIDKGKFTSELGTFDETAFMREQFRIAVECAQKISKTFKSPIELAFEKFMYPFFLYEKKRYIYVAWTKPEEPHPEIDAKGVALIRRDYCPYVKEVCSALLEILMFTPDETSISRSIKFVQKCITDLFENKVDTKKLIISKSLKNKYKIKGREIKWTNGICTKCDIEKEDNSPCIEYDHEGKNIKCKSCEKLQKECYDCQQAYANVKSPHVYLAKQIRKIDPVNHPKPPDRVPYLFIVTKEKATHQCDKVAHPDYLAGKKIDTLYYFEKQLQNPIKQIFELMIGPEKTYDIFSELVRSKNNKMNNQAPITNFFRTFVPPEQPEQHILLSGRVINITEIDEEESDSE